MAEAQRLMRLLLDLQGYDTKELKAYRKGYAQAMKDVGKFTAEIAEARDEQLLEQLDSMTSADTIPLEDIGLRKKIEAALKAAGLRTVGALTSRTVSDLLAIPQIGYGSVDEIQSKLDTLGLELLPGTDSAPEAST